MTKLTPSGLVLATLLTCLAATTPAFADTAAPRLSTDVSCGATGGAGDAHVSNWTGPASTVKVRLGAADYRADGQSVGVRFLNKRESGTWHHYRWHFLKSGKGADYDWYTKASDHRGMFGVGVQFATFKGHNLIHSCVDKAVAG